MSEFRFSPGLLCAFVLAGAGVLAVTVATFVLSFDATGAVGAAAGIDTDVTWLLPVSIDGAMVVATVVAVLLHRLGQATRYPWTVVVAGVALSMLCNGAHASMGAEIALATWLAVAVSTIPAVMGALSVHLILQLVSTVRDLRAEHVAAAEQARAAEQERRRREAERAAEQAAAQRAAAEAAAEQARATEAAEQAAAERAAAELAVAVELAAAEQAAAQRAADQAAAERAAAERAAAECAAEQARADRAASRARTDARPPARAKTAAAKPKQGQGLRKVDLMRAAYDKAVAEGRIPEPGELDRAAGGGNGGLAKRYLVKWEAGRTDPSVELAALTGGTDG